MNKFYGIASVVILVISVFTAICAKPLRRSTRKLQEITVRLSGETQPAGRFAMHATTQVVIEDTLVRRPRLINGSHSMRPTVWAIT